MGAFCCHDNQTKRQIIIILAILNCPYPSNICTEFVSYCFSGFGGCHLFFFFFNLMLQQQPNKMPTYHKTHKWVDTHPMIITAKHSSHHFTGYGENET